MPSRSVDEMAVTFPEQLCRHITLESETTHLLAKLAEWGLPFGIVTNGSAGQRFKVEALGLHRQTSCVFVSALFGARKPEQAIFLAAADCLGMAPHEVLFVGDNPAADIVGARNAGMRTAWLPRGRPWPAHLDPPCADLTVLSLAALVPALDASHAPSRGDDQPDAPS